MAYEISSQNAGIAPICNTYSLLYYIYCVNSYQNVILLFFLYIQRCTEIYEELQLSTLYRSLPSSGEFGIHRSSTNHIKT